MVPFLAVVSFVFFPWIFLPEVDWVPLMYHARNQGGFAVIDHEGLVTVWVKFFQCLP